MKDDHGIAERKQKRLAKTAAETAVGLTIADRLTRSSQRDQINISLEDEGGEFFLEMREPLIAERKVIQEMMTGFKGKTVKQQEKAEKDLAKLLAKHSIDDSLDVAYWLRADFTPSKLQHILLQLLGLSGEKVRQAKEIIEAQSFREY